MLYPHLPTGAPNAAAGLSRRIEPPDPEVRRLPAAATKRLRSRPLGVCQASSVCVRHPL